MTILAYPTATVDLKRNTDKKNALRDPGMGLRIMQARVVDLNPAVCHAVELQAFKVLKERYRIARDMSEQRGRTLAMSKKIILKKYNPH